ncbi:hypothetical protein HGRIS_003218 [Hohenbuehelia grisea]|uniref:Uncharacterized protein n=1 Tax=Hohenbuehelia grisea TaxID=104357 RepID=A0ABR3JNJ3_9AGAR
MYNRRRLEGHTYPAWEQIFAAFAAIDPSLISASQFPIYSRSPKGFDPDDSFRTVADDDAQEGFPDLALLCLRYRLRKGPGIPRYRPLLRGRHSLQLGNLPWAELPRWDELVIDYVGLPIFAELKKFPSRTKITREYFLLELQQLLGDASSQLEDYAKLLFADPLRRDQDSVVLIAGAGEWYQWRVMHRRETGITKPDKQPEVELNEDMDDSESEDESEEGSEEEDSAEFGATHKKKKTKRRRKNGPTKKEQRAFKKAQKEKEAGKQRAKQWKEQRAAGGDEPAPLRYLDLGTAVDGVLDDMKNVVPPEGFWSGLLHLGSAASNQRMCYLRNHLASIVAARATVFTQG